MLECHRTVAHLKYFSRLIYMLYQPKYEKVKRLTLNNKALRFHPFSSARCEAFFYEKSLA
jgi:hypothetical protein